MAGLSFPSCSSGPFLGGFSLHSVLQGLGGFSFHFVRQGFSWEDLVSILFVRAPGRIQSPFCSSGPFLGGFDLDSVRLLAF